MGVKQSKRSVDITSTPAKDGVVTNGKDAIKENGEKIEDVTKTVTANGDSVAVNGDAPKDTNGDVMKEETNEEDKKEEEKKEDSNEAEEKEGEAAEEEKKEEEGAEAAATAEGEEEKEGKCRMYFVKIFVLA